MGWILAKEEGGFGRHKNSTCAHHNQVGKCPICAAEEEAASQKRRADYAVLSAARKEKWRTECPLLANCPEFSEVEDYDGETGALTWMPVKVFIKKYKYEWRVRDDQTTNDPSSLWLNLRK